MKRQIAFVFGGESVEHEISIITGLQALCAFENVEWEAFPLYISKRNEMFVGEKLCDIENYKNIEDLLKSSVRVICVNEGKRAKLLGFPQKKFSKNYEQAIDMAFLCVHGTNVEDGALQGYFQTLGVPIVGCDVESAALSMDKFTQKLVLKEFGIPVLEAKRYTAKDYQDLSELVENVEQNFGYPVVVKPLNLGSSVGIGVADDKNSLISAFDDAYLYSNIVLVERAIKNLREINCSVLGDIESCEASEIEEPVLRDGILSYDDKYMNNQKGSSKGMASVSRVIPAQVSSDVRKKIQEYSKTAFRALGCSGVARLDFMLDVDSNEIYFNEINSIPGSLSFYLWEPLGVTYTELLNRMVDIATKRTRQKRSITFSFDTNVLEGASLTGIKGK